MAILDQLSTYAFAGKNEATIRDNWIVPLLGLLGYGQGSNLYELVSEAPLKLRTPHRKIGSSTLYVDFVPTVMKQRFWILEAKAPDKAKFEDHLAQAWGYATHPDIDVPLMVLADGSKILVYDLTQPVWDKPVVDLPQAQLATRFDELADRLGARQVGLFVEGRQFRHLRTVMHSQVDPAALERIVREVQAMAKAAEAQVFANRAAVFTEAFAEQEATKKQIDASVGTWGVSQEVNWPLSGSWTAATRAVEIVRSSAPTQRLTEFRQFDKAIPEQDGVRHVFWWWRAVRVAYLLQLRDDPDFGDEADALARAALSANLSVFAVDPLDRAAHRLQLALVPLALRIAGGTGKLPEMVESLNKPLTDVQRLKAGYSDSGVATIMLNLFMRAFWAQLEPWTVENLNELAAGAEGLLAQIKTEGLAMLGPAHDPYLERWRVADPLIECTLIALERYGGSLRADEDVVKLVAPLREHADPRLAGLADAV